MKDVRAAVHGVGRALLVAWLLGSMGCEGGGRFGVITFEVAAPPGECAPTNLPSIGSDAPCSVLRVHRRLADGRLEPVPLFRTDSDHSASAQGVFELRFDSLNVSFDARLAEGQVHDLEITVYTGRPWSPAYGARLEGVSLDQPEVRVRLYPFRQWSCPGWRAQGELATRALHQAIPLRNGDVLLLGGVTGEGINPAGAGRPGLVGALLQPVVEVYDQDEHRFHQVTLPVGSSFARVLFDTIYADEDPARPNEHRIRVIGGLTLPEGRAGTAVLGFDNSGRLTTLGAPFEPSADAIGAPAVDLVYDASTRTMEIDESPQGVPTGTTRGAAIRVSSPRSPDDSRAILIGLATTSEGWLPATEYYATAPTGPRSLAHQRLGATIDAMPSADLFFVWGGGLSTTPSVLESAGELLEPRDPASAIAVSAADGTLPPPVAFHTATRVSDEVLVVAGGLRIEATGNLLATAPTDALYALQVASDRSVTRHSVGVPASMMYTPTILHTATEVPGWGVILTGGARVVGEDRLQPVSTAARVHGGLGSFELDDELQDLSQARFGHSATLLPGERLLVTGGIAREGASLRAIATPELIYLAREPYSVIRDGACVDQELVPEDGGRDAGLPPTPDGGPPLPDAGPPPDSGPPLPDGG